VNLVIGMKS